MTTTQKPQKKRKRKNSKTAAPILYASIFFVFAALLLSIFLIKPVSKSQTDIKSTEITDNTKQNENSKNKFVPSEGMDSSAPLIVKKAEPEASTKSPKYKANTQNKEKTVPQTTTQVRDVVLDTTIPAVQELKKYSEQLYNSVPQDNSDQNFAKTVQKSKGKLIFVLDDVGHNTWQLKPFLELNYPLTIAVLPGLPFTDECVKMVKESGKELILHQPMEAIDNLDIGPCGIYESMTDDEIRSVIRQNLSQVSGALGMNNHMGSKATSNTRLMTVVLDEVHKAGIYFLDSLTIGDSIVEYVASLMKQSTWERAVFLDNSPEKESIIHYIEEGTKIANKHGYAIMIGHVWSSELASTFKELFPELIEQGYSLSSIYRIMIGDYESIRD